MPKIARAGFFLAPRATTVVPVAIAPSGSASVTSARASSTEGSSNQQNTTGQRSSRPLQALHPRHDHIEERGRLDIWVLGITIVIGGQYFSWNVGLVAGFYSYFLAYLLIAAAYITLCLCIAEISGALPFAGGAYGLSRCTLGYYPGFLIGCCEALEYIVYVSTTVILFADLVVGAIPTLQGYEPLIWLVFYMSSLGIQLQGGRVFWGFNLVLGSISLFIVVIFIMGSVPFLDYPKYVKSDPHVGFVDGFSGFMRSLPLAPWFFVGVEALPMACDDVLNPKTIVPKAQIACVLTLTVTGLVVYWTSASLPVGEGGLATLATVLAPLNSGFQLMFKISSTTATLFSLPATYATAFGFTWCYGKLIHAMATSRLLPRILSRSTSGTGIPYMALFIGSVVSYALCVVVHFIPSTKPHLYPICITSAFVAYTGQCIGYISLKKHYRSIKRSHFASPCGIPGAVFSMVVWMLGLLSIAAFQQDGHIEILLFLGVVLVLTIFYHGYAKKHQTFSPQENKVLLVAHVMKFNRASSANLLRFQPRTPSRVASAPKSIPSSRQGGSQLHSLQPPSQHSGTNGPTVGKLSQSLEQNST